MRVEYSELMELLGVGHILSAYETRPWFLHDSEKNIMCSAEVRIGPGTYDVEAEIQFLYDEDNPPSEPEPEPEPEQKSDDTSRYKSVEELYDQKNENNYNKNNTKQHKAADIPQQIMLMRFLPNNDGIWAGTHMLLKGEDYQNKIHSWDDRGAAFFCDFVASMQMGELPDIDELIEEHLVDKKRGGRGRRGRVGKKGFKVEQKPVSMGMKN